MIQFVNRKQLDENKYNACITNSVQNRVYAYAWYLDNVADNWGVLVCNDYEAVMPLPWKKKYFIYYISQPYFTQQLGIFSKQELSSQLLNDFLKSIPKKFLKIALQFNSKNLFSNGNTIEKSNYILPLYKNYESLYQCFSKGRKHAIQQGLKYHFNIQKIPFQALLKLSQENYLFDGVSEKEYQKLSSLIKVLDQKNKLKIIGIQTKDALLGGAVFVFHANRIVYLFSAISAKGKQQQVASLLLSSIIQEHSHTQLKLDFEGSQLPGVAMFFKSFGAKREVYTLFKKRLL